jgi:hypothetical protein
MMENAKKDIFLVNSLHQIKLVEMNCRHSKMESMMRTIVQTKATLEKQLKIMKSKAQRSNEWLRHVNM